MKRILIALDYDPTSEKIAEQGYAFANALNAEIILLHVISETAYYTTPNYPSIMGYEGFNTMALDSIENTTELKEAAVNFLEKSKEHLGDTTIQVVVREGSRGESIIETAEEMKVDVIVMGSHGRRGLDKILLGSVAEHILHRTTIPLFIIPTKDVPAQ